MSIAIGNVTTSATTVYTSSGNSVVTFFSITNYTASTQTANVWVVPNGSSASNLNLAITTLAITSNGTSTGDTYQFYVGNEKLVLANGDTLQVQGSNNNSLSTIVSYTSA
jgi:hypothetical protein